MDSLYRQGLGLAYPGYSPGLMHPGLGGPTPFVPPSALPTFTPKVIDYFNTKLYLILYST